MTNYMVEYTYTDDAASRDAIRPEHRAYLDSLVGTGQMLAYGRFGEDGPAGALLLVAAASAAEVESLLAEDPFVKNGIVGSHRVREWINTWGAVPR
ncbi:YciI family protein [Demequina aurantiaca]|uniref:YciI family protein n=1 Tax=Demequina aurantiaca TaxID=676200 RepID=UPI0007812711|nr:YciI family protein [Demequina aurantiaca]